MNTQSCACTRCIGAACTCGCQSATPQRDASCACGCQQGKACQCGPSESGMRAPSTPVNF